jgi:hypothetical protein
MRNNILHNFFASGVQSYGPYVTAYIARLNALGYTVPDATRLTSIDAMFTTIGPTTMAKFDILYIFALNNASLQNAASLNIITPTLYQATYVNSPSYDQMGVMGNGTTSYVNTNFNPATNGVNYTVNDASRVYYLETVPTIGTLLEGSSPTNNRNNTFYSASSQLQRINSGSNNLNAAVDSTGVGYKALVRTTSSDVSFYNETTKSDRTQSAVSVLSEVQTLCKNGSLFSNSEFGLFGMGASLTQAENTTIRSAYLTYRTDIGL